MTKTKRQLRADGMRIWDVTRVKFACPKCGCENEIKAEYLTDEELWYELPVCHWCEECGHEFEVVIDNDNR